MRRALQRAVRLRWPDRWVVDLLALALATAVLPRLGRHVNLESAGGFALVLVAATALLLLAQWALIAPPAAKAALSWRSTCPPAPTSSSIPSSPSESTKSSR